MTCPLAHDGHSCRQPRACLEAAVAAFDRADQRDAELRAAQEFVIWPDSRHHDLFAPQREAVAA